MFSFRAYPTVFSCRWSNTSQIPYAVSLVKTTSCQNRSHILPVQYTPSLSATKKDFYVCISPLYFNYNDVGRIVEMVEFNIMLGANKVVFYNYSIGVEVDAILRYYMKQGVIDVIQWPLPDGINIYYFGQLVVINDCFYRHMYQSKYIVNLDLDEHIVPRTSLKTWHQVIHVLKQNRPTDYCYYCFKNVFYRIDWQLDEVAAKNPIIQKLGLVTLLVTKRELKIWEYHRRSKYIVDTSNGILLGIHQVWLCHQMSVSLVPPKIGLLHHYRLWENSPDRGLNSETDQHMIYFADQLIHRVYTRYQDTNKERVTKINLNFTIPPASIPSYEPLI